MVKLLLLDPQKEQLGEGWGWRYKVRIMDKHPDDKTVLPDEDLPWAQVLLPVTAGSGAANYAQTPQINQGDTVSVAYFDEDEQTSYHHWNPTKDRQCPPIRGVS